MHDFVRRSNLIVPATAAGTSSLFHWSGETVSPASDAGTGERSVNDTWHHIPDAVTLDLADGVPQASTREAGELVKEVIHLGSGGAVEVFVRIDNPHLRAGLEASVWPGLTGVMLPKVEHTADVLQTATMMEAMEHSRGVAIGSLQIIVLIQSALGVWNVRDIITSSPRVTQVALGETELCRSIGIWPKEEYDSFVYARGRVLVEGTAAGVQPIGMAYPLGSMPATLPRQEVLRTAAVAKDLGFKGVICPHSSWVEPVNTAFTPAAELVEHYTQVREVFAQAVAAGTAAVPYKGRMIDVPVDEWAKVVLKLAAACGARDEEKRQALLKDG